MAHSTHHKAKKQNQPLQPSDAAASVSAKDESQLLCKIVIETQYILPALMAATGLKEKVSGEEFFEVFIIGAELLFRMGTLCATRYHDELW